jgi:hypothetical protein
VCELSFIAARTGREVMLPVMYAERGDQLVILVGRAAAKRWWRHFIQPSPVRARLRGQLRSGLGRVVGPESAERAAAEEIYAARYPGISMANAPLVVVILARPRS